MTPVLIAFVVCSIFIILLIPVAIKVRLVDRPNDRKIHKCDTPVIGGIAIFFALLTGLMVSEIDLNEYSYILLASFIIFLVGVVDDYRELSPILRIALQLIAAFIVVIGGGIELESLGYIFGFFELKLHFASVLFTVFAILGVINAVNMIDGMDGLSGSLSIVSLLSIYLFFDINNLVNDSILVLTLCSVIVSFLLFNLDFFKRRNKVFMGDSGSMFIGFIIALLLIKNSQGSQAVFNPVTALWLLPIPLIDTLSVIIRRAKNNSSLFKPDKNHLHHILIAKGLKKTTALIVITILSISLISGLIFYFILLEYLFVK